MTVRTDITPIRHNPIDLLSNVRATNPADQNLLVYDAVSGTWIAGGGGLVDVDTVFIAGEMEW